MAVSTTGKYKSHLTLLIEKATSGDQHGEENWSLFIRICDYINSIEEAPKEGAKIIRKRLGCKHNETIMLTLTLLETCMKNCNRLFQMRVASPKFMQELVKVLNPKHHPPADMQRTVLGLIQSWAMAFKSVPELREFDKTYKELQFKGVEFPPVDPEKLLVALPPAQNKCSGPAPATTRYTMRPQQAAPPDSPLPGDAEKLSSELTIVRQNASVFREMLNGVVPGQETQSDLELLEDLKTSCLEMQQRVMKIIEGGQFDALTGELLGVNDELNAVLQRYEQFKARRATQQPLLPPGAGAAHYDSSAGEIYDNNEARPPGVNPMVAAGAQPTYDNATSWGTLIDLGTGDTPPAASSNPPFAPSYYAPPPNTSAITNQFADLAVYDDVRKPEPSGGNVYSNFADIGVTSSSGVISDPFVIAPSVQQHSTLYANAAAPPITDKESELQEMERWLIANPKNSSSTNNLTELGGPPITTSTAAGQTSSLVDPFDVFLARRAEDAQQPPPSAHNSTNLLDF